MKAAIVLVILLMGVVFLVMYFARSSLESFDPTEQGREARAAVEGCASWTEVLDRVGEPPKWRNSTSNQTA